MNLADRLTLVRVILAPLFFAVYFLPEYCTGTMFWTVPVLWAIFLVSEITDVLDGMAARQQKQASDFGKLFDPFADTLMQVTAFLCFVIDGVFPAVLFLAVLYREFGILFIRNLMLKKGIAMGARMGGKIKTVSYVAAAAVALFYVSLQRLSVGVSVHSIFKTAAVAVFGVAVLFSILSFFDYLFFYRASGRK